MNTRTKQLLGVVLALFVFKLVTVEFAEVKQVLRDELIQKKSFDAKAQSVLANAIAIEERFTQMQQQLELSNQNFKTYGTASDAQIDVQEQLRKVASENNIELALFDWLNLEPLSAARLSVAAVKVRLIGKPYQIARFHRYVDGNYGFRVAKVSASWSGNLSDDSAVNHALELEFVYREVKQ